MEDDRRHFNMMLSRGCSGKMAIHSVALPFSLKVVDKIIRVIKSQSKEIKILQKFY
jgi:hypothetical protein